MAILHYIDSVGRKNWYILCIWLCCVVTLPTIIFFFLQLAVNIIYNAISKSKLV